MVRPSSRQSGLTMIEIIVVVAVLAILAALILTAVSASRSKAYDTRIRNGITQIRWLAESVYDSQGAQYTDWSQHPTIQQNLTLILEDIDKNYGDAAGAPYIATVRESQPNEYCVSAPLVGDTGKHYCIDATGVFSTTTSACPNFDEGEDPLRCPTN